MAVDVYLRIDGITGESQDANFKGQIQLESFSFGASNVVHIGVGAGSGKVAFAPMTATKLPDTTSPLLFLAVCEGTKTATATVSFVQLGASTAFVKFDLGTVLISGITTSEANGMTVETITVACATLRYTVTTLDPVTGVIVSLVSEGWDITKNRKL
jgi:type VI secretion system secreted protein Hcp